MSRVTKRIDISETPYAGDVRGMIVHSDGTRFRVQFIDIMDDGFVWVFAVQQTKRGADFKSGAGSNFSLSGSLDRFDWGWKASELVRRVLAWDKLETERLAALEATARAVAAGNTIAQCIPQPDGKGGKFLRLNTLQNPSLFGEAGSIPIHSNAGWFWLTLDLGERPLVLGPERPPEIG